MADRTRASMLESRKLGASRMTAKFVKSDPIEPKELKALQAYYDKELTPICQAIHDLRPVRAIATSGTLTSVAEMCAQIKGSRSDHGRVIDRATVGKLLTKLIPSTSKQRATIAGLDDQRKDQILAGVQLVHTLLEKLNLAEMQICGSALREGIMLDYLERHVPELTIRKQVPDERRRSVLDLARRCDWHETHSLQVTRLCLELFDQTKALHGLGKPERELIEYGTMLHDIGWHISREDHHKHAQYLILHGNLKGFTDEEIAVMSNIARYHRGPTPTEEHKPYRKLSAAAKKIVRVGAALLRIADGLDRSHSSVVSSLRVKSKKEKVDVKILARADAELEIWGARRKMDFFADVFDRSVSFEQVE